MGLQNLGLRDMYRGVFKLAALLRNVNTSIKHFLRNRQGDVALHMALRHKKMNVARVLIVIVFANGAHPSIESVLDNQRGQTPADKALAFPHFYVNANAL